MLIRYPLSITAPLTLLVPVFALISGYFMYDEQLSTAQLLAFLLFLIGIGLIVKPAAKTGRIAPRPVVNQVPRNREIRSR